MILLAGISQASYYEVIVAILELSLKKPCNPSPLYMQVEAAVWWYAE